MLDLARWKRVGNDGVDGVRRAECMSDMVEECCLEGSKRRVNSGQKECESTALRHPVQTIRMRQNHIRWTSASATSLARWSWP